MKRINKKIKEVAVKGLDIPRDVILNLPKVTMVGFSQLYIENYQELLRFTDEFLIIKLNNRSIKIVGEKLVIKTILKEEIFIEGVIKEFYYIDKGDSY